MVDMLQSDFEDFCRAHKVDAVGVFVSKRQPISGHMQGTILMHPDILAFKPQGKVCADLCHRAAEQIRALRLARERLADAQGDTLEADEWHRD